MNSMSRNPRNTTFAAILVFAAIGAVAGWRFWRSPQPEPSPQTMASDAHSEAPSLTVALEKPVPENQGQVVSISGAKLAAAKIRVEQADSGPFVRTRSVPGRVVYDDDRHIELKAPTAGILVEVFVKPGDRVEAGQALAQLHSPQIGVARADVLKHRAEVDFAQRVLQRATEIEQNVRALVDAVKSQTEFDTLKEQFAGKLLGDYREILFGSYSRLLLAKSLSANTGTLAESGVIARKTMRERESETQSALAALEAACEQAELDVWRKHVQDQNNARDAARRLQIARQHLASLLLSPSTTQAHPELPDPAELEASDQHLEQLSLLAVRAPFPGTIESRSYSAGERLAPGDTLFVLADTRSLWINADIRESNWPAVALEAGQTVELTVPALDNRKLEATVYFVGREVSTETNAIPIIAEIDNADGLLRPGLYVRVELPVGTRSNVLNVPSRAVLRHEEQAFVFVREAENHFRRVDVETGMRQGDRIEILSGLQPGDPIVSQGAFFLKSELLLESEE